MTLIVYITKKIGIYRIKSFYTKDETDITEKTFGLDNLDNNKGNRKIIMGLICGLSAFLNFTLAFEK